MDPIKTQICRLCFGNESSLVGIYDDRDANIPEMLTKHIGEVTEMDVLPKYICSGCFDKVSDFHGFYHEVHAAQRNFIDSLVKDEPDLGETVAFPLPSLADKASFDDFAEVPDEFSDGHHITDMREKPETLDRLDGAQMDLDLFDDGLDDFENSIDEPTITADNIEVILNDADSDSDAADALEDDYNSEADSASKTDDLDDETILAILAKHSKTTCDLCSTRLKTLTQAKRHYSTKHNIKAGYLRCCGLKLKYQLGVVDHVRWHLDPNVFRCEQCGQVMKTRAAFSSHIQYHNNLEQFTCKICGHVLKSKQKFDNHMQTHNKKQLAQRKCRICSKLYSSADELKQHMTEVHNIDVQKQLKNLIKYNREEIDTDRLMAEYFDMKCDQCDQQFGSLSDALDHYPQQHDIAGGYVKCCGRPFHILWKIRQHLRFHSQPELYRCTACSTQLYSLNGFKRHALRHGRSGILVDNSLHCGECDKKCTTSFDLMLHVKEHEFENEKPSTSDTAADPTSPTALNCPLCGRNHTTNRQLQAHLARHRALHEERFKCNVCQRNFTCGSHLKEHQLTHQDRKKLATLPCDQCQRKFTTDRARLIHAQRVHEKNFSGGIAAICEFCAKPFASHNCLNQHIRKVHSNDVIKEQFQCDICKKYLSNKYILKAHMEKHTAEPADCPHCDKISPNQTALYHHIRTVHQASRSFKCHLCDKSFSMACALKDHVATHTGEKAYKCSFCPEAFIWRPNMYAHQKKAHPVEYEALRREKEAANQP